MTGAAMAALCTAGVANTDEAIVAARKYLASIFVDSTGVLESPFGVNTDSNAWAVQGLKACGIDPQGSEFTGPEPGKKTPVDFLISQQVAGGGFRYPTSGTSVEEYASQDAVRALGSGGFTATPPIPSSGLPQWKAVTEFGTGETETASLALIVDNGLAAQGLLGLAGPGSDHDDPGRRCSTPRSSEQSGLLRDRLPARQRHRARSPRSTDSRSARPKNGTSRSTAVTKNQAKRGTEIHVGDTIYLKFN